MGVPAHAHNDIHPVSDTYEDAMTLSYASQWNYLDAYNQGGIIDVLHKNYPLRYLFYTVAQVADHFPSDDYPGSNDYIGDYGGDLYLELQNILSSLGNPPSSINVNDIANTSYITSMRAIAGLLLWFAVETEMIVEQIIQVPADYSTIESALSAATGVQTIVVTGPQAVSNNLLVQSGVTLTFTSNATLNLNGYTISQNGGVIIVEDGAVINGALLKTGGIINAIYPSILAALSASSSGQTIEVISSQTLYSNLSVQTGITLNFTSSATLNLSGYTVFQDGGVITVEDGAVINGVLLKTGTTINTIYPSIQAALNASSPGQTIEVVSSQTVSSDLSVATGRTLSVEPGVTINFDQNTGLTINGKLTAIGTSQNKITFGGGGSPFWSDGIIFNDASDNSSQISNAIIYGFVYGIKCYKANPTITWNRIASNQYGVHVTNASPTIKYNIINQNVGSTLNYTGNGIYVWASGYDSPTITNNRIYNNTFGIQFVAVAQNPAFFHNDIYDNRYNFFGRDYTAWVETWSGNYNNFYFLGTEWDDVGLRNTCLVYLTVQLVGRISCGL